jgi:hypothetical protein
MCALARAKANRILLFLEQSILRDPLPRRSTVLRGRNRGQEDEAESTLRKSNLSPPAPQKPLQ